MAIYGIGAIWENNDLTEEFIQENKICMGWSINQAPSLYRILKNIKIGDIVYIKSFPPTQLRIKAIGIITDDNLFSYNDESERQEFRECLPIRWLWIREEPFLINPNDPYNVRANSLYEEHNPVIQKTIIDLALSHFAGAN